MKYYIHDTTIGQYVYFNSLNELVGYYDKFIPRAYKLTKPQYVQHLADLGHGSDDDGVVITRAISETYNIGVVRNNNQKERTDVFEATRFLKEEYGD